MDDQEISDNMAPVQSMAPAENDGGATSSAVKVRKNFPETWLWESVESG